MIIIEQIKLFEMARNEYINSADASLSNLAEKYKFSRYLFTNYLKDNDVEIKNFNLINDKYTVDDTFFQNIDTEEKAYWLGFIYADGSINLSNKGNRLFIELCQEDFNHIKKFRKDIKSNNPITKRRNTEGRCETCNISINSMKIVADLVEMGCVPNKTDNGFIKEDTLRNKDMKIAFLRGYVDGNGYIEKGKKYRVVITLKSKMLLHSINKMINEFGFYTKIYDKNTYYRINIERKNDFFRFLHMIYDNANIYLDRKYEIFLNRTISNAEAERKIALLQNNIVPNMYQAKDNILG